MIFLPPELTNEKYLNQWYGDDNALNLDDPGLIDVSMFDNSVVSQDGERLLYGPDPRETFTTTVRINKGTKEDPVYEYEEKEVDNPLYGIDPKNAKIPWYKGGWFTDENEKNAAAIAAYNDLVSERDKNQIAWEMQKDRKRQDERDLAERRREGLLNFADSISNIFEDRDYGHIESQFKQFRDV